MVHTHESAAKLAYELLDSLDLVGWTFMVETGPASLDRLGVCTYSDKTVAVSDWVFTDLNEEVEDTIRHEIAHAQVGIGKGHGLKWKLAAKNLGAKPLECYSDGIPLALRKAVDNHKKMRKAATAVVTPTKPPVSYQLTCEVLKAASGYAIKHGETHVGDGESLTSVIAQAVAYCSERRAPLLINFQTFVKSEFFTPMDK